MRQLSSALRLLRRHLVNTQGSPAGLRRLFGRVLALARSGQWREIVARHDTVDALYADYARWAAAGEAREGPALAAIAAQSGDTASPLVSVLMPTRNPAIPWFAAAIASVEAQHYPKWQLCIVDDGSTDPAGPRLAAEKAARDPRIRVRTLPRSAGIAAATNAAIEMADGSLLAFLDHDDELAADALLLAVRAFVSRPGLRLLYTDEDKIDGAGIRYWPAFKPAWNPDLLLSTNYMTHLIVADARLARAIGGLREGMDGAQDWDFALRATEALRSDEIGHLPRVLYHWRAAPGSTAAAADNKPYAAEAQCRVVEDAVRRRGIAADVLAHHDVWRVRRHPLSLPKASIVIPLRNRADLLRECLDGLAANTDYPAYEIVVVDNDSDEPEVLRLLETLDGQTDRQVVRARGAFNFASLANAGVSAARGDVTVLLNNDIVPLDRDWLVELVAHALRPEVGAVGAMLLYPDGTLQHVGIVLGVNGIGDHFYRGLPGEWSGINGRVRSAQDLSAVTAACMAIRTALYREVGGMDPVFAVSSNDTDLCLRLRARGYRIVWTPHARLTHRESASRGYDHASAQLSLRERESALFRSRWPAWIADDPAYNPNLARHGRAFGLGEWPSVGAATVRRTRQEP